MLSELEQLTLRDVHAARPSPFPGEIDDHEVLLQCLRMDRPVERVVLAAKPTQRADTLGCLRREPKSHLVGVAG